MDEFRRSGEVLKRDALLRIVGGWFTVFKVDGEEVVDSDNEVVDVPSYQRACIDFVRKSRSVNVDHQGPQVGELVDSILIDSPEMAKMLVSQITGQDPDDVVVKRIGHFGSFQLRDDETFQKVLDGRLMFSVEGSCDREEIDPA